MKVVDMSHLNRLKQSVCICLYLVFISSVVFSAGTQSDYDRAKGLFQLFRDKVFRDKIEPHWFDDNSKFWYRVQTSPTEYEYILVDTETGTRNPVFDHARLAQALTQNNIIKVSGKAMSLENLQFDPPGNTIQFQSGGKVWQCDLETYKLQYISEAKVESLPAYRVPEKMPSSGQTGVSTTITFVNTLDRPVGLFWLSTGGGKVRYGTLEPNVMREQQTHAGNLWLIVDANETPLCFYQATSEKATAVIGAEKPRPFNRRHQSDSNGTPPDKQVRNLSPDGLYQAFVRNENVGLRKADTDEEVMLTQDGNAEDGYIDEIFWSPDSKKLIVIRRQKEQGRKLYIVESSPDDQLQPKLHSYDYLKPGDKVDIDRPCLFDIQTQKQIPINNELFDNPYNMYDYHWSSDSKRFTFTYNQRGHQVLRVVGIDPNNGAAQPVIDEKSDTFICYSGKSYCKYLDDTDEIIWMSERDGWNHLYLYDANAGQVKSQITKGEWVVREVTWVDTEHRQIWFQLSGYYPEQDPYYIHYARVNFDGSGLTLLTDGNGTHIAQFSPDRKFMIDTYSRVDMPGVHELRRCEDGKNICELERADWSDLRKTNWQVPEPFVAKGRDGQTDIYGIIVRPTTFDPNLSYPVIEDIYAGPQDSFVPKKFHIINGMQKLAELGFIVVQIDGMGTSNRSKKFHDICWKNLVDAGLPDRILWIKAAAKKYPYIDISRVGVYGTSAGGQNAAGAVLTNGNFYKVAVSDCGCHDNRVDKIWWNEQWMGWPVGPEYEANSNVTLAKNLTGKLLLIVGEMDQNVDPASTMQVVNALIKADKDFDLLVIPGAGHGVIGGEYPFRRMADYFVRNLLGVEPRSNP